MYFHSCLFNLSFFSHSPLWFLGSDDGGGFHVPIRTDTQKKLIDVGICALHISEYKFSLKKKNLFIIRHINLFL